MASGLNDSRHCSISGSSLPSAVPALAVPPLQRWCWKRNHRFRTRRCQRYEEELIRLSLNTAAVERYDRLTCSLARAAVKAPVIFIGISKLKLSAPTPSLHSTGRLVRRSLPSRQQLGCALLCHISPRCCQAAPMLQPLSSTLPVLTSTL